MAISELERKGIKREAEFLEHLGYTMIGEDPYIIEYQLNNICIIIGYPPREEFSDITIKFIKENSCFHMGWIAFVRSNIKGCDDKYINIKILLDYIRENYISVTDYQYCVESDRLIDKYVDEHSEIFEKAVSDFLDKQ